MDGVSAISSITPEYTVRFGLTLLFPDILL
jgi:hypothetical protein